MAIEIWKMSVQIEIYFHDLHACIVTCIQINRLLLYEKHSFILKLMEWYIII